MIKRPRNEQYELNVSYILGGYENYMNDYGIDKFPPLSLREAMKLVSKEVYSFITDGKGLTSYSDVAALWASELRFIPRREKQRIVRKVAEECGVLREESDVWFERLVKIL